MGRLNKNPDQYRRDALKLVESSGRPIADVARSLGIAEGTLAGPFLPIRNPEWATFVHRVQPIVAVLTITPAEARKRLLARRHKMLRNDRHKMDPPRRLLGRRRAHGSGRRSLGRV